MSAIDPVSIASTMVTAAKAVLVKEWPKVKGYAEAEAKKLADTLSYIVTQRLANKITEIEAGILIEMQKNAARNVLLTIKGMGLVAAEMAINAALKSVSDTVNTAIGFALL